MKPLPLVAVGDVAVAGASLACCAVETQAALAGAPPVTTPTGLVAWVVAGTVTDAMAPLLADQHAALLREHGDALRVVAFGSCASSGGPYWDSSVVTRGVGELFAVDVHVPGCPPRPDALIDALEELS